MSGHNKWSQIKHRKGINDAKRSKVFTKINKEISVAVKEGGVDPQHNARLRAALSWAKEENMPSDNVQRALKKASGHEPEDVYEEIIYEGFGPSKVAILIECMTNNRNRTISSIRTILNKNHAHLGGANTCLHLFQKVGMLEVDKTGTSEEKLMELLLELPILDLVAKDETFLIITEFEGFKAVADMLEKSPCKVTKSEIAMLPKEKQMVGDEKEAHKIMTLVEALEEDDDVQKVFGNFEFEEALLNSLSAE